MTPKITRTRSKTKSILTSALIFSLVITVANIQSLDITISAYGQTDFPPFEVGDIMGQNDNASQVTNNISDTSGNFNTDIEASNCVMPPCPPGQACIQSCP